MEDIQAPIQTITRRRLHTGLARRGGIRLYVQRRLERIRRFNAGYIPEHTFFKNEKNVQTRNQNPLLLSKMRY